MMQAIRVNQRKVWNLGKMTGKQWEEMGRNGNCLNNFEKRMILIEINQVIPKFEKRAV